MEPVFLGSGTAALTGLGCGGVCVRGKRLCWHQCGTVSHEREEMQPLK